MTRLQDYQLSLKLYNNNKPWLEYCIVVYPAPIVCSGPNTPKAHGD